MGKIYVDQTALKLDLDTGIDLTSGVTAVYIKYKKPGSDTISQWTGSVENNTHITKSFPGGEIDTASDWKFWSFVEFTNGTEALGEPVSVTVHEEGH